MIQKSINYLFIVLIVVASVAVIERIDHQPSSPNPDDPTPGPAGTLRVMFLTDHTKPLTQEQTNALSAADVLDYENSHCAKDGVRRFDVWEKPEDLKNDTKFWQDAFAKHGEAPSVTVWKRNRPATYQFPKDVPGMMDILTKAGGK